MLLEDIFSYIYLVNFALGNRSGGEDDTSPLFKDEMEEGAYV